MGTAHRWHIVLLLSCALALMTPGCGDSGSDGGTDLPVGTGGAATGGSSTGGSSTGGSSTGGSSTGGSSTGGSNNGGDDTPDDTPDETGDDTDETGDDTDETGDDTAEEIPAPAEGELVITEIMKDPDVVSDEDGEWFELLNVGDDPVDLEGCRVQSAGDPGHVIDAGAALVVEPGAYIVLGPNADLGTNGGVAIDYPYANVELGNGEDSVTVRCGATLVDSVAWEGGDPWPDPKGASLQLDPLDHDAGDNDDPEGWCAAVQPYGDGDLGTPGGANDYCGDPCEDVVCDEPPADACDGQDVITYEAEGTCELALCSYAVAGSSPCGDEEICKNGSCEDPGDVVPPPSVDELVITEIMKDPDAVGDDAGEWFEVLNVTEEDLDLVGCRIESEGDLGHTIGGEELVIEAGAVLVLGGSTDDEANGGAPIDYAWEDVKLANGADTLALLCNGAVVDAVAWDEGETWPDPKGASMQLGAGNEDAGVNDDGAAWCASDEPYGDGDLGSPGSANLVCAADPCEGVDCSELPPDDCDGTIALVAEEGACVDGDCVYTFAEVECADLGLVCDDGECVEDGGGGDPDWPDEGDVIFTELMNNPFAVSDEVGEWFEVANVTSSTLVLEGCHVDSEGNDGFEIGAGATLSGGELFVFAIHGSPDINGGVDADQVIDGDLQLGNGSDTLILSCGGVVIDEIAWDNGETFPDPNGASMQLDPELWTAGANDAGGAWCAADEVYGAGDLGTPGEPNTSCDVGDLCEGVVCDDPPDAECFGDILTEYFAPGFCSEGLCSYEEATTDCGAFEAECIDGACVSDQPDPDWPHAGQVVITEIMQNPAMVDDADGEWFELTAVGDASMQLGGCRIVSNGDSDHTIVGDLWISKGDYLVVAVKGDAGLNGGLHADYAYGGGIQLANSSDSLAIVCGESAIDEVAWDNGLTFPDPAGKSMQLDVDETTASLNDSGANWCEGSEPYGLGDLGSPGVSNKTCAVFDPCAGVSCHSPPADHCQGNSVVAYAGAGVCVDGECEYEVASTTPCGTSATCSDGVCVPDGGGDTDCCTAHSYAGCDDASCQSTVCAQDSYCCNSQWDGICENIACQSCTSLCDCGGGNDPSDCCSSHNYAGCDDSACQTQVCNADGFCCSNQWDNLCSDAAQACAVCQ